MQVGEQELERLVEVITRAVQARMGRAQASVPPAQLVLRDIGLGASSCADGSCGGRIETLLNAGAQRVGAALAPWGDHGALPESLAATIDHTLLKPEATLEDVRKICDEARAYGFASVCVNPSFVAQAKSFLADTRVKVVAVVGFPLGATMPAAKAYEACQAAQAGADEIDMVVNIGAVKGHDYKLAFKDIRMVVDAVRPAPVKVILETSKLNDVDKVAACALAKAAGAAYVKTSTGFGGGGATAEDIALMRRVVGESLGVKASGGVRTQEQAHAMIEAGANRIGASASVAIVTGKTDSGKGY